MPIDSQGVFWRNNTTGAWTQLASPATKIVAGDLDGDGIADLIGIWPSQGGVWVRYSATGTWAYLSSTADWIATGDMNGDGRAELLGTWTGQGVYWRNNTTGIWTLLASPATKIVAGDIDGDGIDDLIGTWAGQSGAWVQYSSTQNWEQISQDTPDWLDAGKMRPAGNLASFTQNKINAKTLSRYSKSDPSSLDRSAQDTNGQGKKSSSSSPNNQDKAADLSSIGGLKQFRILFPNGDEKLRSGNTYPIVWEGPSNIKNVKIEFSSDNGSTFLPVVERTSNQGTYDWEIPEFVSGSSCLIRISDADKKVLSSIKKLLYELDFRVIKRVFPVTGSDDLTIWFGDPSDKNTRQALPRLSFRTDAENFSEVIDFEGSIEEFGNIEGFYDKLHRLKILLDLDNKTKSLWMDGKPLMIDHPIQGEIIPSKIAISGPSDDLSNIQLDNFLVKVFDSSKWDSSESSLFTPETIVADEEDYFVTLIRDEFEKYEEGVFPLEGGWRSGILMNSSKEGSRIAFVNNEIPRVIKDSNGENGQFKIWNSSDVSEFVAKSCSIPNQSLFDVSDYSFSIGQNYPYESNKASVESNGSQKEVKDSTIRTNKSPRSTNNLSKTATAAPTYSYTYFIYSFDGHLLAEYDNYGNCVRDYIYLGNRLFAEYRPQENKYYYYNLDQINSVRMITDDLGNIVYSAVYSPYGKIQKEWVKTYKPKLQFSGKEREAGSDVDYFSARYYANTSYRFLSPDPVIRRNEALMNPQLWNLYAYCRNNPISYLDLTGQKDSNINVIRFYQSKTATIGVLYFPDASIMGFTLELPWQNNAKFTSCIPEGFYSAKVKQDRWIALKNVKGRSDVYVHPGLDTSNTEGCILVGENIDLNNEKVSGGWNSTRNIMEKITSFMKTSKSNDENIQFNINIVNISRQLSFMGKIVQLLFGKDN
jgi:RHS repeat-associated protein